jgi:hypothetical protein
MRPRSGATPRTLRGCERPCVARAYPRRMATPSGWAYLRHRYHIDQTRNSASRPRGRFRPSKRPSLRAPASACSRKDLSSTKLSQAYVLVLWLSANSSRRPLWRLDNRDVPLVGLLLHPAPKLLGGATQDIAADRIEMPVGIEKADDLSGWRCHGNGVRADCLVR